MSNKRQVTSVPLIVVTKTDNIPTLKSGGRTLDELEAVSSLNADTLILLHRPDGSSVVITKADLVTAIANDTHADGMIYTDGGSTVQSGLDTTPVLVTGFTSNGPFANCTPDAANDKIIVGQTGGYQVAFQMSFAGTNSETFHFQAYRLNDSPPTALPGLALTRKMGTGGDVGSGSFVGLVHLDANDEIGVYVDSATPSGSITPVNCQLVLQRVS